MGQTRLAAGPAAPYPGAVTIAARDRSTAPSDHPGMRPQTLMLTFLGEAVLGREVAVYSGTFVEVMQRLDVSEEATRSTLTRMVSRDLLARHRRGRKMYFGLTSRAIGVLAEGADRLWGQGAVNRDHDAGWTLLGFSLPESRRDERHQLRSRLRWAGFGPLRSGLWIAPGSVDVAAVLQDKRLLDHVQVFRAEPVGDVARIVREAFDLTAIAARYGEFLRRWRPAASAARRSRRSGAATVAGQRLAARRPRRPPHPAAVSASRVAGSGGRAGLSAAPRGLPPEGGTHPRRPPRRDRRAGARLRSRVDRSRPLSETSASSGTPGRRVEVSCAGSTAGWRRRGRLQRWILVPLAVPAPLASRQSPDWTPVMVPLALRFHCWLAWPLQSQMITAVPLLRALAAGVQALVAVHRQLPVGGVGPALVGAAVAVPQLHLGAVRRAGAGHVDAAARLAAHDHHVRLARRWAASVAACSAAGRTRTG